MNSSESYDVTLTRLKNMTLFNLNGEINALSEPVLNNAYKQTIGQKDTHILFNFNPGTYINSAGIAIFIHLIAQSTKHNQMVGITGLSAHFKKIFNMLGITKFATIYDSFQSAMETLNA